MTEEADRQMDKELRGNKGMNDMMREFKAARIVDDQQQRALDPNEKVARPIFNVEKVKPNKASLTMRFEEWGAWYFKHLMLHTLDSVVQDIFISELYEDEFWQKIKHEQTRKFPSKVSQSS